MNVTQQNPDAEFFRIDTMGDLDDPEFCFVDGVARGLGEMYYRMAVGKAVGHDYPDDVTLVLEDSSPGLRCGTVLGNTQSYLILDRAATRIVQDLCEGVSVEYLPVTLLNHRNRVHSADYFFVNPVGSLDCLDLDASDIQYSSTAKDPDDPSRPRVLNVLEPVLDPEKLTGAPALFRVRENPRLYVLSRELAEALEDPRFDNIELWPITTSPRP